MIDSVDERYRSERHLDVCQALEAGIDAALPSAVLDSEISLDADSLWIGGQEYQPDEYDRLIVIGGGKAAGAVATELEAILGDRIDEGIVLTNSPADTVRIEVGVGGHPLPTTDSVAGTDRLLAMADSATADDLVVTVISGGGSALLCAPAEGLSLDAYRTITERLIESGATIDEINAVRKHLSRIKGGQLARELAPAETCVLVFSDVVGNRLDVIASGPLTPDESTYADAQAVLDRYHISVPDQVQSVLSEGLAGDRLETVPPGDGVFERVSQHILADNRTALSAAAEALQQAGYRTRILSDQIEGEARDIAGVHAEIARHSLEADEPFSPPIALLSGGETTVTVSGDGTGGPNQEFVLAAALAIAGGDIIVAAVDTDGNDGPTSIAGALVDGKTITDRSRAISALDENDAGSYLTEQAAVIQTGKTGTNVNDLRILLVGGESE